MASTVPEAATASKKSSKDMPTNGHTDHARRIKEDDGTDAKTEAFRPAWDFWLIILVMCTASFTSALDATILTTALPHITDEIGGQDKYSWIANSFLLSGTVLQPLYGQLSNIFGRRNPYLISMALFILGSGIAGGSKNIAMLIAGRTVQGCGSAGLFVLSDIIVADLVPLRERAKYMSLVMSTAVLGTIAGPIVGGALAQADWRWCFYINLPLGGPSLVAMIFFLKLKYQKEPTWKHSLARVDWIGNLIFIPAATALIFGLIAGGQMYPWSSWRTIVPIVLGSVGWICFHIYESSPVCKNPGIPPRVFSNRTSAAAFLLTFLAGMMLDWITYFLPLYFQSVWGATPLLSGVYMLPTLVFMIPSASVAGGLVSKNGQYKQLHWAAFALMSVGVGLFSILKSDSSPAEWVFFQVLASVGIGFAMTTLLPAVNADLEEKDVAAATSVFSFLRSFGFVWGITIPSTTFNNQFDARITQISDTALQKTLQNGAAYGYATSGRIRGLTGTLRDEVVGVYTESIKFVWYVGLAFTLAGFLAVFLEKHLELRTTLDTEFGIDDSKKEKRAGVNESVAEKGKIAE